MRPLRILTLAFLLFTLTAAAQTDRRIEEQKRVIAALEKRIATEEQEISKIQKGRSATEERVRRLARQIDSRNQLLDETEKQARLLRGEIARTDSVAGNLSAKLERDRAQYGEMVREAYRNYKHNNYYAQHGIPFDVKQVIGLTNNDPVSKEYRPLKQIIERLNRTFKGNYRATTGFGSQQGSVSFVTLFCVYFNFLRPHAALEKKVPVLIPELDKLPNMPAKWTKLISLSQDWLMDQTP
jgi:hypothetical protein